MILLYNNGMYEMIRLIKEAQYPVAFTGAGVSTFSGLKDFRGEKGIGKTMEPEKIFDIRIFDREPAFFYQHARELVYDRERVKPSIVHLELARLEKTGYIGAVITQNIDMLHQRAGSKEVIELHGSAETGHCRKCGKEYGYNEVVDKAAKGEVPFCEKCGGPVKPDITFYGETLPEKAFIRAVEVCSRADLIIVLGSTLVVQPAASFVSSVLDHGGKLIIVNNQPTPYDMYASYLCPDLEIFCRETSDKLH